MARGAGFAADASRVDFGWPQGVGKASFAHAAAAQLVAARACRSPVDPSRHSDPAPSPPPRRMRKSAMRANPYHQAFDPHRRDPRPAAPPDHAADAGQPRAIIIDPADDLETGAVNALLKSLEEPRRARSSCW
jgi:DNA polymerase-3 subunit delta'